MLGARLAASLLVVVLCSGTAAAGLPTVTHEGRGYVELARVAETLKTKLDATADSTQARLRANSHVVTFTRNWSRILVDGSPIVLDAPVVVRKGTWLVPETFLTQVMPKLAAVMPPPAPPAAPTPSAVVAPVALDELRTRSYPSFTRLVLESSGPITHKVEQAGGKQMRIRLVGLNAVADVQPIGDGFVESARLEKAGADAMLTVAFEGAAGELRASSLTDPPRLVLDFMRPGETAARERPAFTPLRTIVLDAGHGGHDSGAVGPGGLQEKELVLDVTRRVARLLEDRVDVRVKLSRDADTFVTLKDRTSFANRERADLFVSIHANAHRDAASQGVEVYFLSSEATDSIARQVAATENSVVQLEKTASGKNGRTDIVKTILWDLAQSEFQDESSRLAEIMLDTVTHTLHIPNRGVKQAGFYVLGGAAMPAILVEIGFVTNPKEEKRLKDSRYRDEIARAIVSGLADYKRAWDQRARAAAGAR
ncbi:MAG TPA: N-acetylmuramoyl-L-alanine amidase [Methylomirabilota bacterium]|nr:N-acetylmuramoyl-L-alanine amidase [Methylomirabilota bacterium]